VKKSLWGSYAALCVLTALIMYGVSWCNSFECKGAVLAENPGTDPGALIIQKPADVRSVLGLNYDNRGFTISYVSTDGQFKLVQYPNVNDQSLKFVYIVK
jgi:hypothetical protein